MYILYRSREWIVSFFMCVCSVRWALSGWKTKASFILSGTSGALMQIKKSQREKKYTHSTYHAAYIFKHIWLAEGHVEKRQPLNLLCFSGFCLAEAMQTKDYKFSAGAQKYLLQFPTIPNTAIIFFSQIIRKHERKAMTPYQFVFWNCI